jgi:peptidoglycan/LPS O-acetylase OafA/YrhL
MTRNGDIDILRGFAVMGTFLAHLPNFTPIPKPISGLFDLPAWGMGVDLFFVISGYLIASSLLAADLSQPRVVLRDFWIRRSFRILPASFFWLAIAFLVSVAFAFHGDQSGLGGTIRSSTAALLNVSNVYWSYCIQEGVVNATCGGGANMSVWWSLSLEEQFYIVFPITLLFLGKRATGIVCVMLILYFGSSERFFADLKWMMRLDGISYGVLLAFLVKRFDHKYCDKIRASRVTALTCLALIPLFGGAAYNVKQFNALFFALSVASAALCVAIAAKNKGAFNIPWVGDMMRWLGAISFSFYLCHESVLVVVGYLKQQMMPASGDTTSFVLVTVGSFLVSVAAAYASAKLIENPAIGLGRDILSRRSATTVAART